MIYKRLHLALILSLPLLFVKAQVSEYSGTVYGPDGFPLQNVTVSAKGTSIIEKTNGDGYFTIEVPDTVLTLVFEHPDMKTASSSTGVVDVININMVSKESDELAELSLEELMNISITVASSKGEDIFSTISAVTVIDRNTIDRYAFESVQEAVQTVAGIDIYRTYLKKNLATARGILQDHYANKVLIMINNVPVWHAVTGEGCLDRVNIHDVERIEVLKGPASVLYGTNAYSGAINIILREKTDYSNSTFVKAGNNGLWAAGSHIIVKNEDRTFFLSANVEESDGAKYNFTDESGIAGQINEFTNTRNITGLIKDKNTSILANYYEVSESYFGVTPNYSSGAGNPHELKGFVGSVRTNIDLAEDLSLNYTFQYDWNHRDLSRTADDDIRARIDGYRINNQLSFQYDLPKSIDIEIGGNWEYRQSNYYENYFVPTDTVIAQNNMSGISLNAYSAFGQINYKSEKLNFTLGTRFTHNELFKNNLSSRATLVYKFNSTNSLKLVYGESFRAPSLFEQNFTTSSYTVVGNSDLTPETSRSIEIVYLKRFEHIYLQLTPYYALYEGKIFRALDYYAPANDSVNVYTNGESFAALGFEAEFKYINPKLLNGFLNINYISGNEDDKIGDHYNFKYIPAFNISAGLSKSIRNFVFSGLFSFKSATNGPQEEIGSSYKLDINMGYRHNLAGKHVKHSISAKNIADSNYLIPEYVRLRTVNEVPFGYGRRFVYTFQINF